MSFIDQAKQKFRSANVVERLIVINLIVFVFFVVFKAAASLFQLTDEGIMEWLVFSKDPADLLFKPWSIITYAFLHGGLWHILANMLILYYAGGYFLTFFSPKKLLSFYFLGAIAGAAVFSLSYNLFPAFAGVGRSYLIGASAAVMAILVGIATHVPHLGVRLLFLGTVKLWHIAAFFVLLDFIRIPIDNPGGHLAHLGGALLGYTYAKQLQKGNNIGAWWENFMDWVAGLFSSQKEKPLKTVHRKKKPSGTSRTASMEKDEKQKKIDAILDKISKNGYESLSKQEKDFLFKSGKED